MSILSAADADTGIEIKALEGKEMNIISDEGLSRGARYTLSAKLGKDASRLNPGAFGGERLYAYLAGIEKAEMPDRSTLYERLEEKRDRLNLYLREAFDPDSGALVASLTTGERSWMSEDVRNAFNTTGLAHLLSISGTHFGLFSMLLFGMFRLLINLMPYRLLQRFTLYLTPSQASALLSLPFMLLYLLISGYSIPAVRSFIMITIFLAGLLIGRKGFWLNSLLFAAFLIVLWDPVSILDISFQLSFLAVLFIGLSVGEREETRRQSGLWRRVSAVLKNTMMVSLSASLGTALLVIFYFHYFSILSPVSNLFVTPFIGFVLVPLSLLSTFIFILSGHYPFQSLIQSISGLSLKTVKFFASIPFADIKIPAIPVAAVLAFYAGCIVFFFGRKRYGIALACIGAGIAIAPVFSGQKGASVTYLDVGQGDSAVIETPSGKTLILDTGGTGKEPDGFLRYLGKRTVDALIITHADDDHSGGTFRLMKNFRVREVWDNGLLTFPAGSLRDVTHRSFERGDEITFDSLRLQILHPYKGFYTVHGTDAVSENNDSLVLKLTGKKSFLFTADTAAEAEEDMVHFGRLLVSDVLKVSHHGSGTSTTEDFLRAVSPEIAVISVGRYNKYGHPHPGTLERLSGRKIYRTDRDGAIKVSETLSGASGADGGLAIKTYRDFEFEEAKDPAGEWRNMKRLFMRW
ncbi:MAG TPA: DNA internalization-related competence protein ComEC/Rec2 [Thermodesulfovibrionales bacterium]|nr:DNA internalization-related competence protein ComEC/Rec2 [Thermodesulfovibrionales bacterium]